MLEWINVPWGQMSLYDLSNTLGTILGILTVVLFLWHVTGRQIKKIVVCLCVAVFLFFIGGYVSSLVRQLTHADHDTFQDLMNEVISRHGNHFIGRIFPIALFFPVLYRLGYRLVMRTSDGLRSSRVQAMNAVALFIVIQHFFNRLACLLRGCCYGIPYKGIGALQFPNIGYQVFPSQLFEMLGMVLLGVMAILLLKHKKPIMGSVLFGFSVIIDISEHFIDKRGTLLWYHRSIIQYVAIMLCIVAIITWLWERKECRDE